MIELLTAFSHYAAYHSIVMCPYDTSLDTEPRYTACVTVLGLCSVAITLKRLIAVVIAREKAVNSIVTIEAPVGTISATISNAAVAELGLEAGREATAVIKATSVMIGC